MWFHFVTRCCGSAQSRSTCSGVRHSRLAAFPDQLISQVPNVSGAEFFIRGSPPPYRAMPRTIDSSVKAGSIHRVPLLRSSDCWQTPAVGFDAAPTSLTAARHRTGGWSEFPAHPQVYAFNKLIDRAAGKLSCYRLAHEFALMTGALTHLVAGGPCRALLATVFSGKFNEAAKGFTPQNTRMVFQRDPNGAFAPALCCRPHPPSAP